MEIAWHQPMKQLFRFFAVEYDVPNIRMPGKKFSEVVYDRRIGLNIGIQTAGSNRTPQHIPQGYFLFFKLRASILVAAVNPEQLTHDQPERILRMGVILLRQQRLSPGQAAKHKYARVGAGDWRKTLRRFHSGRF
jgi:hypothetical protein